MNLPSIFQNNVIIKSNNMNDYIIKENSYTKEIDIHSKINNIINFKNHTLKIPVTLTLKNNEIKETYIIGRTSKYLITINNELILFNDIIDITKK